MLDKKYLRALHAVNQDVKKIFDEYYIFSDGMLVNKDMNVNKGKLAFSELYKELYRENNIILMNSQLIFTIFKNKMSHIEGMEIRGDIIGAIVLGEFHPFGGYKPITDALSNIHEFNANLMKHKMLTSVDVDDDELNRIMKKELVSIETSTHERMLICKATISTIKKNSKITIEFGNLENDIFHTRIIINGNPDCKIVQVHRCLNI